MTAAVVHSQFFKYVNGLAETDPMEIAFLG